jgi:uncharacterized coiled-coil protein SlyX
MTQSNESRIDRIEALLDRQVQVNAELTSAINFLVGTVSQQQEKFMVLITEIRRLQTDDK